MKKSGLLAMTSCCTIAISGEEADYASACAMAPPEAQMVHNPPNGVAELPTIKLVQDFARHNPDFCILYIHTKGALHHGGTKSTWAAWRHCMSRVVIWGWQACVRDLTDGWDCVGAHWLTPRQYPSIVGSPYFAGNFWWATARHIRRLPPVDITAGRYEAEAWIGRSAKAPTARDYRPHFPGAICAQYAK